LALRRRERITNALVVPTMLAASSTQKTKDLPRPPPPPPPPPPCQRCALSTTAAPRCRRRSSARQRQAEGTSFNAYGDDRDEQDDRRLKTRGSPRRHCQRRRHVRDGSNSAASRASRWCTFRVAMTTANPLPHGRAGRIWVRGERSPVKHRNRLNADPDGSFDPRHGLLDATTTCSSLDALPTPLLAAAKNIAPAEIESGACARHGARAEPCGRLPDDEGGYRHSKVPSSFTECDRPHTRTDRVCA